MVESAGILAYRNLTGQLEFFLVHPGGPFFSKKDAGFWTIPKGLVEDGEDLLNAAKREFLEETGFKVSGEFILWVMLPKKEANVCTVLPLSPILMQLQL